jgi:hypothetical protein
MKVVRLSSLRTGRLYPSFCKRLSQPQGHSAAGKIISVKTSSDTIGIEPTTLQLVAQCLNQLHHRVPLYVRVLYKIDGVPEKLTVVTAVHVVAGRTVLAWKQDSSVIFGVDMLILYKENDSTVLSTSLSPAGDCFMLSTAKY